MLPTKHYYSDKIGDDEIGRVCGTNGRKLHIRIWLGNIKERDHMEYLGVNWIVTPPCVVNRVEWERTEWFVWLRTRIFKGSLQTQKWTFDLHKMRVIFGLRSKLLHWVNCLHIKNVKYYIFWPYNIPILVLQETIKNWLLIDAKNVAFPMRFLAYSIQKCNRFYPVPNLARSNTGIDWLKLKEEVPSTTCWWNFELPAHVHLNNCVTSNGRTFYWFERLV